MSCEEYASWIADNLDGVLAGDRADPGCSTPGCARCAALLERHRAIRETLRSGRLVDPAPTGLETRIRARIADVPDPDRGWFPGWVYGLATAMAIGVLAVTLRVPNAATSLDPVIGSYRALLATPAAITFRTDEPDRLADVFGEALGETAPHVLDLEGIGLRLVGGSLREVGGHRVRVAVYEDADGRMVCHFVPVALLERLALAPGERRFVTHRGVHFCLTRVGDEVCVLATESPTLRARLA